MPSINIYLVLPVLLGLISAAPTTPADTHHALQRRADCMEHWSPNTYGQVNDAAICIQELAAKGNTACKASIGTIFCIHGDTVIEGNTNIFPFTQSTCQDVARGAGRIMDTCSRADGKIRGLNYAWGNGNLQITIHKRG